MNSRDLPQPPAVRQAFVRLGLGLVLLTPSVHAAFSLRSMLPVRAATGEPAGYLPHVGAPALRFQNPPLPPAEPAPLAVKPARTDDNPANDVTRLPPPANEGTATAPAAAPVSTPTPPDSAAPSPRLPAPILRDEIQPTVRPEELVPYFQIPGAARQSSDVTLLMPAPGSPAAPGSLPPSSATYTQSPK
jgi:hypothetical protein